MPHLVTFGPVLRRYRENASLSLRELSRRIEVDVAHLSRLERDTVAPSEGLLERIAGALDVPSAGLWIAAGRVPSEVQQLAEAKPYAVARALEALTRPLVAEPTAAYGAPSLAAPGETAIEDGFPFERLSDVAEVESWRKEIWRPIYHLHKWWAQRLGSVFRATVIGACVPRGSSVMDLFYSPVKLPAPLIFDPFMGSGTTIGEAHKLGCSVIGRDINPVAHRNVSVSLSRLSREDVKAAYRRVQRAVAADLLALHRSTDRAGRPCDVLYWFWVKHLPCPECDARVDLFSTCVFAKHAYVKKHPTVRVSCPGCGDVFAIQFPDQTATCQGCEVTFDPHTGPVERSKARCSECSHVFPIAKTARERGRPPSHRLYAKLVVTDDGEKQYLQATDEDRALYADCERRLKEQNPVLPTAEIQPGHNTRQVLSYGYSRWVEFFNARQLLGIAMLADAIGELPSAPERDALLLLLSGVLEFNNMFASYKGEGTGAVRHMFSHHVLRPQRTPLEANLWGTPRSSGSFSTLFERRIMRAINYKAAPFELRVRHDGRKKKGTKIAGLAAPMGAEIETEWPTEGLSPGGVYLSCGDSAQTDIPDAVVDAVITDPPFFDSVHYSELADFFHAWQALWFREGSALTSTRHVAEVQDADAAEFASKLSAVFRECHRVLKARGLLVFSYHHSREDGWSSVARAVADAGFSFVQAQPVKAEMSVATPKLAAKSPIDLDVMLVCVKRNRDGRPRRDSDSAVALSVQAAATKVTRFNRTGRELSLNDVRVVVFSQVLVEVSAGREPATFAADLPGALDRAAIACEAVHAGQLAELTDEGGRDAQQFERFQGGAPTA